MTNNRLGLGLPAIIGIVALVLLIGASLFLGDDEEESPYTATLGEESPAVTPPKASGGSMGVRDFDRTAYDKAVADGKLIIVFTNSITCGEQCRKEIDIIKAVFADPNYANRPIAAFILDIDKDKAFAHSIKLFAPDGKAVVFNNKLEAWSPLSWARFDYENYIEIYTYGEEDE